ncbi:hypothetical protein FHY22_003269 [Xanthomonas arboricola]|nr:hypothetical protein [Xanthomonas arboricola]
MFARRARERSAAAFAMRTLPVPSPPPRRALARVLPCRITGARRDRCSSNSHDAV